MRIEWNNCFLCLNDLKSSSSPGRGGKKRGRKKKVNPKVLLKYLLETCGRSTNEQLIQDILQLMNSENGGDDDYDGVIPASSPVQLCDKCETATWQISNLHRDLEVVQMKLADKIKSAREVIISNSKEYGQNDVARMCLKGFEDWLEEQGKLGVDNGKEKRILEILYAFQNAVHETESCDIPLVFVKKLSSRTLTISKQVKVEPMSTDFARDELFSTEVFPDFVSEPTVNDNDDVWSSPIAHYSFSPGNGLQSDSPTSAASINKTSNEVRTVSMKSNAKDQCKSNLVVPECVHHVNPEELTRPEEYDLSNPSSEDIKSEEGKTQKIPRASARKRTSKGPKRKNIVNWARDTNRVLPSTNTHNEITSSNLHKSKPTLEEATKKVRGPYKKKDKGQKERFRYECEVCSYKIKNIYRFEQHLRDHESEDKGYTCDKCDRRFSGKQLYEFHQECHAGKHKILCEFCNTKFSPLVIVDHMKTHADKVFPCNNCSYCCMTRDKLIEHLRKHCTSEINCDVCSVPIRTRQKLLEHLHKEHRVIEEVHCNVGNCKKSFLDPYNLWIHKNVHNKQFPCPIPMCDKTFAQDAHRKIHLKYHNGEKTFSCNQCSDCFYSKSNLERHMISQHGAKKHKCEYCSKEYADRSHYLAHVRLHEGGGIKCTICSKVFGSERDLRRHKGVHQTERNFVCEECGKAFRRPESLKKHKMIHIGDKKFKCTYCPKAFVFHKVKRLMRTMKAEYKYVYLVQHLRIHTGERPFVCDYCGKAFNQYGALYTHKKVHTGSSTMAQLNSTIAIEEQNLSMDQIEPESSNKPQLSSLPGDFNSEIPCGYPEENLMSSVLFEPSTAVLEGQLNSDSNEFKSSSCVQPQ